MLDPIGRDFAAKIKRKRFLDHPAPRRNALRICYQYTYEYFKLSSFHGLKHLTAFKRHGLEYFLWLACLVLGIYCTVDLSLKSWDRYQHLPTVNSIDRNYKAWNTSLPAILLSPDLKISPQKLNTYIDKLTDKKEETRAFVNILAQLNYKTFSIIPKNMTTTIPADDYMRLLYELRYDLQFNPKGISAGQVITEMGLCHLFNSVDYIYDSLNPGEFFHKQSDNLSRVNKITEGSFLDNGIIAVVVNINKPSKVQFSSAEDIPTVTSGSYSSPGATSRELDFEALSIISSPQVQLLAISQRKCRFRNESNLELSPIYTYNFCQIDCRRKLAISTCQCSPHFYPKIGETPTCDLDGLRCLDKYKEILLNLKDPATDKKICQCLPSCEEDTYYVQNTQLVRQWFRDTSVKWVLDNYPRLRIKRELLFGFSDLCVSIGGAAALFLGCSVLSFVELSYFFSVRPLLSLYMARRKRQKLKPRRDELLAKADYGAPIEFYL